MFVRPQLLPPPTLEKTILEAFYRFYDNATNGNRTRGGMKNAFQTCPPPPPTLPNFFSLHVLDDPNTGSTIHAVKLVSATHALSNYSLSLTPSGVPITPAQIRMNKDPGLLVVKVIENNPPVHREGERMIKILDDLIDGTQLFPNPQQRAVERNRMHARVYAAIIVAALADRDFTTAYATCVTNLAPLTTANDDTINAHAWHAFYKTGSYTGTATRPGTRNTPITPTHLDYQKMELLARAILICPKEYIEDCLDRWTTLETKLLHPELVQPDTTRVSGEHRGFLAMAADVARTASPIIGGRNGSLEMEEGRTSGEFGGWGSSSSRFGVRDTVKSGLTQGIGWLLGAPTQPNPQNREQ